MAPWEKFVDRNIQCIERITVGELRSAFMYDPKCSTTFPWCTINAPAAFAWCTINAPAVFAWCTNQFVHKVEFSYIEWNGLHTLWYEGALSVDWRPPLIQTISCFSLFPLFHRVRMMTQIWDLPSTPPDYNSSICIGVYRLWLFMRYLNYIIASPC